VTLLYALSFRVHVGQDCAFESVVVEAVANLWEPVIQFSLEQTCVSLEKLVLKIHGQEVWYEER